MRTTPVRGLRSFFSETQSVVRTKAPPVAPAMRLTRCELLFWRENSGRTAYRGGFSFQT